MYGYYKSNQIEKAIEIKSRIYKDLTVNDKESFKKYLNLIENNKENKEKEKEAKENKENQSENKEILQKKEKKPFFGFLFFASITLASIYIGMKLIKRS